MWVLVVGRGFLGVIWSQSLQKIESEQTGEGAPVSWKTSIKNVEQAVFRILGYEGSQETSEI